MLILRNTVIAASATQLVVLVTALLAPQSLAMLLLGLPGLLLACLIPFTVLSGAVALWERLVGEAEAAHGAAALAGLATAVAIGWGERDSVWQYAPLTWVTVAGVAALISWVVVEMRNDGAAMLDNGGAA